MTTPAPDRLARWRAERAATVGTVSTALPPLATPRNTEETAIVATVGTVASKNNYNGAARASRPDAWLATIARTIRAALADGAEREADPNGWLRLIRADGRRCIVAPRILAALAEAELLPPGLAVGALRA